MNSSRTCEVRLGDLVERVRTWNPMRDGAGLKINYIDLSSVDNETKSVTTPQWIVANTAPSRARQIVQVNDVLVSTVRPNLNGVARVEPRYSGATASTGFCVLRANTARLSPEYLFHWVRSPRFVANMVRRATGASYPAVSDKVIFDSEIPLPPLDQQRRVAEILDQADELRRKRRESIEALERLPQAIFAEMFDSSSRTSREVHLQDAVRSGTIITHGIVQAGEEFPGGVPYIRTGDIVGGEISCSELRHTDPAIAARFARSRVSPGEIVMSIRATVGTTALVPEALDGANLTQGTARIAPGDKTNGLFLLNFLRAPATQHWIQRQVKGATFREITLNRLRELPVRLPPLDLQREFANRVRHVHQVKTDAVAHHVELEALFASLQHRGFSGELTPNKVERALAMAG